MLTTIEGIYRNGHVDLAQKPASVGSEARVLVTFLESNIIDLREIGMSEVQAKDLRARLSTFAADWDSSEMDVYDERYGK
jgi:hypothetical protein